MILLQRLWLHGPVSRAYSVAWSIALVASVVASLMDTGKPW